MSYLTDADRMENGWIPDTRTKCPDCGSKRFNGNLPCSWCGPHAEQAARDAESGAEL